MPSAQIAVRLPAELLVELDALVRDGAFASRAHAVRAAIEHVVDSERRHRVGEAIAEGYRRIPSDDELDAWAEASARAMIEEEPW